MKLNINLTPFILINSRYFLRAFVFIICMGLKALVYSQPIKIACVGNSITYGARIENREQNSYPAQLASMLGRNYEVGNFGRNGATLLKRGNLPYWDTDQYKEALAFNPDWVLIKLGTNDTKPVNRIFLDDDFKKDYQDLILSFKNLPSNPRIVLLLPVPVFSEDTTGITASVVTDKLIPMIRQLAYETGCEVINLYNLMIDQPELFPDHVHPNAAGATVMAQRLYDLIRMRSDDFDITELFPGDKQSFNFHGFQGYDFEFMGRKARVVSPKNAAMGHPWVWRARFFGHEPQTDIALLERGFHIAYCDVAELFGNDDSMNIWDGFYQLLTNAGLSQKSFMEGMSRGGVYIYRWAAQYPERVSGIYADAPVLDLKSWPGGKGVGKGSPDAWQTFQEDFGFKTEEEALAFKGNPIDLAEQIVQTGIPMLHVVGDADVVVPVKENTALFEKRINSSGGLIQVIHKPGVDHHPHSLENPQPIVDFALKCTDDLIKREQIEWLDVWLPHTNEDSLPRVLLIGNSITRGYHRQVDQLLEGKAYVSRMSTSKSIGDPALLDEVKLVMNQQKFDVIHFNNGLHGWSYTEDEYERSFLDLVNTIKGAAPNAQLIWASTTPLYEKGTLTLRDRNERVIERNRIADVLLASTGIPKNDLYTLGVDHPEYYENSDGTHPNKMGYEAYARQVAKEIEEVLRR